MVAEVLDPPVGLGQEQLASWIEERLGEVVGRLNQAHAELVQIAAMAVESGAWAGPGLRSPEHWLTWQAGISTATASQVTRVAAARNTHPQLTAVFDAGGLTLDQAAVAVTAPVHNDAQFASLAPLCTVGQIRTMVRAASPPPDDGDRAEEYVRVSSNEDGSGQVRARLEVDNVKLLEAAIAAARERLFRGGVTDVSNVDAFADVCRRSLSAESSLAVERFRTGIVLDPEDPIRARWANGTAVPDAIRRRVTCDGWLTPIFTKDARPVSVGRSQHIVPERTRQVVLRRDRQCRAPWCDQTWGWRSTTSCTGKTAARATPSTSSHCVGAAIGGITGASSTSEAMPTTPTGWCSPTVTAGRSPGRNRDHPLGHRPRR